MIRKLLLSAVVASGAVSGLALTPQISDAAPPVLAPTVLDHDHRHGSGHRDRYQVLVRHGRHWDACRTYNDRDDAQRAARRLERRGYDAKVRRVEFSRR